MAKLNQYFSTLPSSTYIFQNGKAAVFVAGVFRTAIKKEIEELDHEISIGHPHLLVRKGAETVESEDLDPMVMLRKKFFAEFQASQQAAFGDPSRDMGNTPAPAAPSANAVELNKIVKHGEGKTAGVKITMPGHGVTGMGSTATVTDQSADSNGAATSSVK